MLHNRDTDPNRYANFNPLDADREDEAHRANELMERIADLLADDQFAWAHPTLDGIYNTLERMQRATAGQRRAVDNIDGARRRR